MGGSGGGGGGFRFDPGRAKALPEQVAKAQLQASEATAGTEVANYLADSLKEFNNRDAAAMRGDLNEIEAHLGEDLQGSFDVLFGGSVAKHTYIDGLSDVDAVLAFKNAEDVDSPKKLLDKLTQSLSDLLGDRADITHGKLAVTVKYKNGVELQLIPAIRDEYGMHVPSWREDGWSAINPQRFTDALTKRNAQCGQRLIPTIKLAKAINANLPEDKRLTGYHMESLAIASFRDYKGSTTLANMLSHFMKSVPDLLKSPIKDRTGQSVHVDEYLGAAGSTDRTDRAHLFERLSKRLDTALTTGSITNLGQLLGEE
jgi:hypothetical protein